MATATAPVVGKRKREDGPLHANNAKKPALLQIAKPNVAKARVNAMVAQMQAEDKALTKRQGQPSTQRKTGPEIEPQVETAGTKAPSEPAFVAAKFNDGHVHVQLVTGSYERVLHGVSAKIPQHLFTSTATSNDGANGASANGASANGASASDNTNETVTFSDTFLFAAHASSIRCLAVSPSTESDKRYLATGSSDERINVYSVSIAPPTNNKRVDLPTLTSNTISENPRNRSLGSLIHHDRAITHLEFPTKGKLFSAAEDNTIAISRTRDWTVLSSVKAPIPKPQGRPSGDTAGPGETPAGVNDFAIHPSQKLMLSVGRGERCLRLWNLMTGKKAGVLNFDRNLLAQVGEGKYSSGEGRQVLWNDAGDAYVVGFERGAAVYGIDSKPKALVRPSPSTKLHRFRMLRSTGNSGNGELLAVSTEDGRILLFDVSLSEADTGTDKLPLCECVAQLGGREAGVTGRIKDFEVIHVSADESPARTTLLLVTASSDGAIRLWHVPEQVADLVGGTRTTTQQVGSLIATLETDKRITCFGAFVLDGTADGKMANGAGEAELGAEDAEGFGSGESE